MEIKESQNEAQAAESKNSEFKPSTERDKWEQVGFHRALGGFLHNIVIGIASTMMGVLFIGFLTGLLYPYPEIQGYNKVSNGFFFIIIYQIFDFGTAFGIQRFIAEYRIKNPKRMIQYVQFFIWYQMLTGLIQVTVISLVVIYIIRTSEYAYLTWLFLIICQKQWPGMLGTFGAVLEGMQLYNRTNVLKFITSDVIQNITNVTFILLGRYLGGQNPMIGELMGAAMGTAIGMYVDDFFAMAIGMKYLKKKLFPIKINWWQTLFGPLFVSIFVYFFGVLYYNTIFKALLPIIGILPTAALSLLFGLTLIPFLIYMPLTGFFGVWDDFNIKTFENAVAISGPSKFLANLFYKSAKWGVAHSPWHNKFKTPWEEAEKEIDELMKLKETAEFKSFEKSISEAPWLKSKKK